MIRSRQRIFDIQIWENGWRLDVKNERHKEWHTLPHNAYLRTLNNEQLFHTSAKHAQAGELHDVKRRCAFPIPVITGNASGKVQVVTLRPS